MSKIALYHQHGREPVEMTVVKSYKDGTVDLAYPDSTEVVVAGCKVSPEAVPGGATLPTAKASEDAAKKAAEEEAAKKAAEEEAAKKAAEEEAAKKAAEEEAAKKAAEEEAAKKAGGGNAPK